MRTIYLDACAVNRPFDDQSQERIRLESEAVLLILARVEAGELRWIGSEVLDYEIACIPDPERLRRAQVLLQHTAEILPLDPAMEERARRIEARGFSAFMHFTSQPQRQAAPRYSLAPMMRWSAAQEDTVKMCSWSLPIP